MTCYLGESVYVTGGCSAVIVSNGHPGEETSRLPWDRACSICMLKTTTDCNYVGGGRAILSWWDGTTWQVRDQFTAFGGSGYAWVKWSWQGYIGHYWWKIQWEDCTRIFRTGDPWGIPCEKYVTVGVKSIDPATKKAIAGSILYLKPRDAGYATKWCKTDSTGQCTVSGICAGIGHDMQISVPGYESLKDYIAPTSDVVYTWPLATTPPSVTPPGVLPEELAQEKTERQQADAGLAGTISAIQASLDGFKAWIVDGILDVIWTALTREKKVG